MNRKTILANFKMNKTNAQIAEYFDGLLPQLKDIKAQVVCCVPATGIQTASDKVKDTEVWIAGQNINQNEKGAYTGEVSADMVVGAGAKAVVVGHSERRAMFGETDETVNQKILRALKSGLVSILCVGESLVERKSNKTRDVLKTQIMGALTGVYSNELKNIIIAYEPIWSISTSGTGKVPPEAEIKEAMIIIREIIASIYDAETAENMIILYGGSVDEENSKIIAKIPGVDGAFVGGASLDPTRFAKIVTAFNKQMKK